MWSSDLTNGTYTAQSGYNYTFSTSSDGNITVSLNDIATAITTADVLVSNGVIHVLADALWNLTPNSTSSESSPCVFSMIPSPSSANSAFATWQTFHSFPYCPCSNESVFKYV